MPSGLWFPLAAGCILTCAFEPRVGAGDVPLPPRGGDELVYFDFVDEAGSLRGGRLMMALPDPLPDASVLPPAEFTTLVNNGPSWNRIDLVFVGDGYTAAQLGNYATHVNSARAAQFAQQPFMEYAGLFNVHRVDVISNESGVDNDPVQGIQRDTAMNMGFWCNGIERLLCISVSLAYGYAVNAPGVDQVFASANSTTYGGAGYSTSELATFAGGNSLAAEIAIHELGHSLGNLADEYDYGDGAAYTGPERPQANASILTAAAMSAAGTKWAAWLGSNNPAFDGLVNTYQGCEYHQFGIYRPTNNSKMRSLNRPFNSIGAENLIIEMYKIVNPIDAASPTGGTLCGHENALRDAASHRRPRAGDPVAAR
jgi:hypothetical protein